MAENQNDSKAQGSQTGQNQGNQNQGSNQKANPMQGSNKDLDKEEDGDGNGTKMPGRQTTTPVAEKENRESNADGKKQNENKTEEQNSAQAGN